jgi:membrane protein DedA with SNARE-associated domain
MSILGVILAGTLGSIAGNAVWFEAARAFGTARTRALVERYGRWWAWARRRSARPKACSAATARWRCSWGASCPASAPPSPCPRAWSRMPRVVFYPWTALGTLIWTSGLALGGYFLEDQFHLVEDWAGPIGLAALGAALVAVGWHFWKARRASASSEAPRSTP